MTLTDGEKALALQMYSIQHMRQADIAKELGVSQSAISYLTRKALGAQTGQRTPRIDPSLPATMLRGVLGYLPAMHCAVARGLMNEGAPNE